MPILPILLGAILGSLCGLAAHFGLTQSLGFQQPWSILLVGLLAGLGVQVFRGKSRVAASGVIAAVIGLATILGYEYATINTAQLSSDPIESQFADQANDDPESDDSSPDEATNPAQSPTAGADDNADSDEEASREAEQHDESAESKPTKDTDPAPETSAPAATTTPSETDSQFQLPNQTTILDVIALGLTGLLAFVTGRTNARYE